MTSDKAALFAQFVDFFEFLDYLKSEQAPPDYFGTPPTSANSFDSYQIVADWTALRQEVKQQGKLLRAAQDAFQQALAVSLADKEQIQQSLTESHKQALCQFEQQQEKLLRDLLGIMDALDRACAYWQEEIAALSTNSIPKSLPQSSFWQKLGGLFSSKERETSVTETSSVSTSVSEILISNQEGVELIRRSLLDLLRLRQVVPIETLGKPFDSQKMYAIGRQKSSDVNDNVVVQEVVQGYLWGNRVLREAQVIVSSQYTEAEKFSADTE